jgi:hypothetical protein
MYQNPGFGLPTPAVPQMTKPGEPLLGAASNPGRRSPSVRGQIRTSAGIAAGIDLALSLVGRDHGPALTAAAL